MGRQIYIDGRNPDKKPVYRMKNGERIPLTPESAEVDQSELLKLRADNEEWERQNSALKAQLDNMKQALKEAREETKNVRKEIAKLEDKVEESKKTPFPSKIEILSVTKVQKKKELARLLVCCDIEGTVDDTQIILPFVQLKELVKS